MCVAIDIYIKIYILVNAKTISSIFFCFGINKTNDQTFWKGHDWPSHFRNIFNNAEIHLSPSMRQIRKQTLSKGMCNTKSICRHKGLLNIVKGITKYCKDENNITGLYIFVYFQMYVMSRLGR